MSKSNAQRIGVFGASGSGKSSFVKQLIAKLGRVVVFDPLDEYSSLGFQRVRSAEAARRHMVENWANFRIALVPASGSEPRILSQLSALLLRAQEPYRTRGVGSGITLVVEEMNLSFPVHGGATKAPSFAEICSRGRHYGIEVYGLSQRIAEVSTRFRGNCTQTVILRQQGPRDTQAAIDAIGVDKAKVQNLKNLQYLHERNGEIKAGSIKFK